jgi:hypothetical protein
MGVSFLGFWQETRCQDTPILFTIHNFQQYLVSASPQPTPHRLEKLPPAVV